MERVFQQAIARCKCDSQMLGMSLASLRNSKEARIAGVKPVRREEVRGNQITEGLVGEHEDCSCPIGGRWISLEV